MVYCHISAQHSFDADLDSFADINAVISRRVRANVTRLSDKQADPTKTRRVCPTEGAKLQSTLAGRQAETFDFVEYVEPTSRDRRQQYENSQGEFSTWIAPKASQQLQCKTSFKAP
jgi:hypothetical protein